MNPIQQALQILGGIKNAFTQVNPYPNLKSPIPPQNEVSNSLPAGFQSPIPQGQIVQHQQGPSAFQSGLDQIGQGIQDFKNWWPGIYGLPGMNPTNPYADAIQTLVAKATPGGVNVIPGQKNQSLADTPVKQAMATLTPTSTPTATPTQTPQPFSDFTTTKVPSSLSNLIYTSAVNAGVDPNVFASLLFSEHGFLTDAGINKNSDGSYDRGIAQINSVAHPEVSDKQAQDPNFAIPWAANLLGKHLQDFGGDYNKAVASYNIGEGGVNDPQTFNTAGKAYLKKVSGGLTKSLVKKLGL